MTPNLKNKVVNQFLNKNKIDALLLYSPANRLWITEFSSSAGYVLVSKNNTTLCLDGRYITDGQKSARNITEIIEMPTNTVDGVLRLIKEKAQKLKIKIIGFDQNQITVGQFNEFKKHLTGLKLLPLDLSVLRMVKTENEIVAITKATVITDNVFQHLSETIRPGMTEEEISGLITNLFFKHGAKSKSFDSIVVSGTRGALPHGMASKKIIKEHELVTIDIGCKITEGYCSDITRTFAIGETSEQMKEIFKVVAEAQQLGIEAIKPNIACKTIDKICRDHITKAGYGEYFNHSTGHGLGIDVHEAPRVSPFDKTTLKEGMIITVEPGIYIPDVGGVRIEDDILVTKVGYKLLSRFKRYNSDMTPINVLQ